MWVPLLPWGTADCRPRPGPGHGAPCCGGNMARVAAQSSGPAPYLPRRGPQAACDLDVKMVHDIVDNVPPVIASGRGHGGDSGESECLPDRPSSAAPATWSQAPEGRAAAGEGKEGGRRSPGTGRSPPPRGPCPLAVARGWASESVDTLLVCLMSAPLGR